MTTTPPSKPAADPPPFARALAASWRVRGAAAVSVALGFGLWSNHLTDHIGYASSLIVGLVGSASAALVGVRVAQLSRGRSGSQVAAAAALAALALVLAPLVIVLARAAFAPACAPATGAVYALLFALPGPVLAALVGASLGAAFRRRGAATAAASLLVPAFVAWSLARFYATPTIFAYDPFYGFFPGAIYDESVPLTLAHVTHRVGTLGWIVAAAALIVHAWEPATARLSPARLRAPSPALGVMLAGLLTGVGVFAAGPALGHRHDAADIARALERRVASRRCVVLYDRSIDAHQAALTARDCDVRVEQLEQFYGVRQPRPVTVFLFANSAQKRELMGAEDTYVAKPWRHEVYLQYAPFPHPVLKHELAHVVAGAMAGGPFRVTALGRLLPAPGLIEGAAVAAAWEGESDASPHQWSRAMLEAGLTPSVASLSGLGFFAASSGRAYTAAGSFCRWLIDTRGRERFRRYYRDADADAAYGESLGSLEAQWRAFLRGAPTPDGVLARARTRFRRASVFGRTCPLLLEDLARDAAGHLDAGDLAAAERELRALIGHDPTDLHTRLMLAVVRVRAGDLAGAAAVAGEAERALGPAAGQRARSQVADQVWRWRGASAARPFYEALDASSLDDDEARTLTIKRAMIGRGGLRAEAFRDLLIGRGELDPSPTSAMARLSLDPQALNDPWSAYLAGRQLFAAERFGPALEALRVGDIASLGEARVLAEALRMRAVALYRSGELGESAAAFSAIAADESRPAGSRDAAADWLDRIRRESPRR
jgi:hypothetical protein